MNILLLQSTLDTTYPEGTGRAVPYIEGYVISSVNFKGFLIVGAKFGVR
jgi:hypothetical protein